MTKDKLLTLRQASELFQIEEKVIGQLLRDGYLRGYKIGRGWRISYDDLNSFTRLHPNVSPRELRSGKGSSGHNGAQLHFNAPVLPKGPRAMEATKSDSGTRKTLGEYAVRECEPKWVPPWRLAE